MSPRLRPPGRGAAGSGVHHVGCRVGQVPAAAASSGAAAAHSCHVPRRPYRVGRMPLPGAAPPGAGWGTPPPQVPHWPGRGGRGRVWRAGAPPSTRGRADGPPLPTPPDGASDGFPRLPAGWHRVPAKRRWAAPPSVSGAPVPTEGAATRGDGAGTSGGRGAGSGWACGYGRRGPGRRPCRCAVPNGSGRLGEGTGSGWPREPCGSERGDACAPCSGGPPRTTARRASAPPPGGACEQRRRMG